MPSKRSPSRRPLAALLVLAWLWHGVLGLAPAQASATQPWADGYLCSRLATTNETPAPGEESHAPTDCPLCIAGHCALAVPSAATVALPAPVKGDAPATPRTAYRPHRLGPPFHSRAPPAPRTRLFRIA